MAIVQRHPLADSASVCWHVYVVGRSSRKLHLTNFVCNSIIKVRETTLIKTRSSVVAQVDPGLTLRLKPWENEKRP